MRGSPTDRMPAPRECNAMNGLRSRFPHEVHGARAAGSLLLGDIDVAEAELASFPFCPPHIGLRLYRSFRETNFAECSIEAISSASDPPRPRNSLAACWTSVGSSS